MSVSRAGGGAEQRGRRPGALGRNVRRKEDQRLITGHGRFVSDIELPWMRHVAFLRSPYGHARITGVDADAARAAGYTVFTGDDFAHVALRAQSALPGYVETAQPVLAHDKARFSGEAVAAVVAKDRYRAEDGLELLEVGYEALHPTVCAWNAPVEPVHAEAPDNVLLERTFQAGSVADAFDTAAVIVERELVTNRHAGNPMECRAGVAVWDAADGKLTFYNGTQVPHIARNMIAELMGLPEGKVRVVAPDVGGGFGVKAVIYPEDVALCLMARQLPGIPLKWVEDRAEHLLAATHARDHRYLMKAGFDEAGTLLAVEADVSCNVGAYSVYPWTAGIEPLMAGGLLTGPYKLDNYRATVRGVATNTAPSGPYRGVARPASVFAMETCFDEAASRLGIDPVEIRRRNVITPEDIPYTMPSRLVDDSGHYTECLDKALEKLDYAGFRAEQARRREAGENPIGFGVALYNELTGLGRAASAGPRMPFRTGHDACTVRINPDGRATVLSGITSQGQGSETMVAQIVSDALGLDYDDVDVRIGDTDESLWGFGAFSSRQAVIGGGAAHNTAMEVRAKLLRLAAGLIEAAEEDLQVVDGEIYVVGDPKSQITVAEVARVAYLESNRLPEGIDPGLDATTFFDPIRGAFAAGAQVATIEVDRATGELKILAWVCVEDAGRAMHPQIVDGQIAGSIAQGLGGALYEHLVYDEAGNLSTGTLLDYLMPTSAEVPDMVIGHVSRPAKNPLGVRGVGEGGTLGPNAVLAGAVRDALGIAVDTLPLSPGSIWKELQS